MAEHDLHAAAFPMLSEAQMAGLDKCPKTRKKSFNAGEKLFEAGQCNCMFFIIKSGEVEILDLSGDVQKTIVVHKARDFTGELSQLTGSTALVTGIARTDCEVYEVTSESLREIINNHPDMGDLIVQAFIARRQLLIEPGNFAGLRVIGSRFSADTFRIREFLAKNRVPFTWLDLENDPALGGVLKQFGLTEAETPAVACGKRALLRKPSNRELADCLGIRRILEQTVYDLIVVGAGPGGLAAAVYGASEGLSTLILERSGPGGQAGRSMRIENYLGFATGITGAELVEQAVVQVTKFGARLSVATGVSQLTFENTYAVVKLEDGGTITGKSLLIACGAQYRKLDAEGCTDFEGCGVYYAATFNEVTACRGAEVVVVGAGNSAGQAAVFLSGQARKVYLVVRGNDLTKNMSTYLATRIEQTSNIEILLKTEVKRMMGDGVLKEIELVNNSTGERRLLPTPAVFSFLGADPRTDWLPPEILKDAKDFVLTGPSLNQAAVWTAPRPPFYLETSRPGIFAAGDVRSGSVKRVASAVGEGAMAVQFVHEFLKQR